MFCLIQRKMDSRPALISFIALHFFQGFLWAAVYYLNIPLDLECTTSWSYEFCLGILTNAERTIHRGGRVCNNMSFPNIQYLSANANVCSLSKWRVESVIVILCQVWSNDTGFLVPHRCSEENGSHIREREPGQYQRSSTVNCSITHMNSILILTHIWKASASKTSIF